MEIQLKNCTKCFTPKSLSSFYSGKNYCISCVIERAKIYRKQNKEKIKIKDKNRYVRNREKILKQKREYGQKNKEKLNFKRRVYYKKNQKEIQVKENLAHKKKRKENLNYRIEGLIRTRIYSALKGRRKSTKTFELLGCTADFFNKDVELKFKNGMTWENHGKVWEIDHIIPCDSFDLTNPEERKKCCHYTNLQPLWATTELCVENSVPHLLGNLNKSNKIIKNEDNI